MQTKQMNTVLKLKKKTGLYANTTGSVTFNPETLEAHSYRWWRFVAKVDGLVVFNAYRYSNSTSKHQNLVRRLLADLGIKIDLELSLRQGINSSDLNQLIIEAEEQLCDKFLAEELKRQDRNERARIKRAEARAKEDAQFKANMDSLFPNVPMLALVK